jgi:C4-dicarboxylate-specific signal transduction histidine kinase
LDFKGSEEIAFFGKVNASISHKLNNILATISETAGLLGDLVEMSEQGTAPDVNTLRVCCDTIVEEIHRGFGIVKIMNRFAHSGDVPVTETDITDVVNLVSELVSYLSYAKTVNLDFSGVSGVNIVTRPLYLEKLLYITLDSIFKSIDLNEQVSLSAQPVDSVVRILISVPALPEDAQIISDETNELAEALNARMDYHQPDREFTIVLPHTL